MHKPALSVRALSIWIGLSALLGALGCLARGVGLFLTGRPRTLLRVGCIVAFDTLHWLRQGKRLPKPDLNLLAALLDFAADTNATLDQKKSSQPGQDDTLHLLAAAGLSSTLADYLQRLASLEAARPQSVDNDCPFQQVVLYREEVVRLSLGLVATAARHSPGLDEAIQATRGESDLHLLFCLAMQCQIIDDVLDYPQDQSAGLPSFLTVCTSLPRALELTLSATRDYADGEQRAHSAELFPFRLALYYLSLSAKLAVALCPRRVRTCLRPQPTPGGN